MKKKKVSLLIAVIAVIAFLLSYIISYANTGETIYVNLTKSDINKIGYGIGNPANGTNEKPATSAYIWNITTYDSDTSKTASKNQRNLYCIKANYGASWNTNKDKIVAYNLSYDLQADRTTLLNKIVDNGKDVDDVVKTLLSESGYYRELLWILDNSYIENTTDKTEFLNNVGIKYDSTDDRYYYEPIDGYDYSSFISGNSVSNGYSKEHLITDSDIKAVQRAAIWYYTNYLQDTTNDAIFNNKNTEKNWLTITTNDSDYQQLADYNKTTGEGPERFEQAQVLYNYLIDAANKNASKYTEENNYTITNGVAVNTTDLTQNSNGKYKLVINRIGSNYVMGPIVIDKNGSSADKVTIEVTNQSNKSIDYKFTDSEGNALEITDINDLVGKEDGFYITVPKNGVEKVNVKINVQTVITKKTLWLNGTETKSGDTITSITLNAEQPIVEVIKEDETIPTEFEAIPEEFDLALRKYITQVNSINVSDTRVPNIDLSTLDKGTTATYKHRKDPVVVKENDIVTYTLAIYNEGNKAGYAKEIIDQLPTGLIYLPNNEESSTVVSKDKNGNSKNTYTLSYNSVSNQIKLTIVNTTENSAKDLNAYKTNNLDYETIEIKCKVIQEADSQNQIILTNVAYINKAHDSVLNKDITTSKIGEDRDSAPGAKPSVTKDNMKNYKGDKSNPDDLSNSNNFYKGEQDDDDFEKLVIEPVKKEFDLELVKFIAAVSKDNKIDDGEYLTDTKNADGVYTRAPKITIESDETKQETHRKIKCDWSPSNKQPLLVEPGDFVLYTIRVYNAGEADGYASLIKDHLPVGLEFAETADENADYYGIWKVEEMEDENGDERQVISTNYLAKGKGKESNAKENSSNYTANLLKALKDDQPVSDTEPRNPDYRDVQILCKVTEQTNKVLVNYAQISEDTDKNGNDIDDEDSTPDNLPTTGPHEDDEDLEKIHVKGPERYDLVLVKEDKDGEQLNSKATFEVTTNGKKEEKTVIGRLTIAENVLIDGNNLTDDVYVIKETKAPDEYCKYDGIITITVSKKEKADGSGYEKSISYTVVDSNGKDIKDKKDAKVYLNEDGNIYVEVKNYEEPEIHKGVKELPNQDSGYDVDEIHTWVIESDIPSNLDDYKFYSINDDIDYRLKFEGIDKVVVKIGNTKLKEGTDYKISFVENSTGVKDKTTSGKLTLTFLDIENKINASSTLKNNQGNKIQVTFNTSFAKDENGKLLAEMGEQIENQAKLEYKNTSNDNKIIKESEKPEVHTGGVVLYKYYALNEEKISLEGAKFGIYATEDDAKNNKNVIQTAISDEKGIVRFIGLQYGGDAKDDKNNLNEDGTYKYDADKTSTKYWIAEIEAPDGYQKYSELIEVTIDKDSYNEEQIKYEVENKKLNFDLALRKFITEIQEKEIDSRYPQIKIEDGKITYEHSKNPLTVHVDDKVIYTIRVYNEGDIDGYASEITDDIPEYLEYLPDDATNAIYKWKMYDNDGNETESVENAVKVKTTYLSKENGEDNLLKAFGGTTSSLDYKEVKIAFKVKDPSSNSIIITNHAQISEDTDKDGNPIEDIDSKTDEWNEGEDDQDIENVKVEYFDLALLKFVSKVIVIEDGKENITETGYNGHENPEPVVKVELHKKKLNNVVVKFGYGITITNEGDIPGYATEITDYVPEGLRFEKADNPLWTDEGNNVISTKQLEDKLLQPGESATVEVILTWINGADNLALKTNIAEISEDKNEYDVPDRDSTPDNKKDGEDDIDIAKVILAITTGAAKTYFILTIGLLTIVLVGVILIKKFVI